MLKLALEPDVLYGHRMLASASVGFDGLDLLGLILLIGGIFGALYLYATRD